MLGFIKNFVLTLLLILVFFAAGLVSVLLIKPKQSPVVQQALQIEVPTPSPVVLQPPTDALTGSIRKFEGNVGHIPWDVADTLPATIAATLFQGDEITTDATASAEFSLANIANISQLESTSIVLSSLLPKQLVLTQKGGKASYDLLLSEKPLSIRIGTALIQLESGSADVSRENDLIEVNVPKGKATVALVNGGDVTKLYRLNGGTYARIDTTSGVFDTTGEEVPGGL